MKKEEKQHTAFLRITSAHQVESVLQIGEYL